MSGLVNLGNSCYMNSILQILVNTHDLNKFFASGKYLEDFNKQSKESHLIEDFVSLIKMYKTVPKINPIGIRNKVAFLNKQFANLMQQDGHEFLVAILDIFHSALSYSVVISYKGTPKSVVDNYAVEAIKSWNIYYKKQYSYIIDLFHGQFHTQTKCGECDYVSDTFDPFCYLSLPIQDNANDLEQLIDEFTKGEELNDWKCEKCKKSANKSKKTITFWTTPKIFIIQLKRFDHVGNKITKLIQFSDSLSVVNYSSTYNAKRLNYELYATCNHVGGNQSGGHYYSVCKDGQQWIKYDDDSVCETKVGINDVYLLFYKLII